MRLIWSLFVGLCLSAFRVSGGQYQTEICRFHDKKSLETCQEPWKKNVRKFCGYRRQDVPPQPGAWAGLAVSKAFNGYGLMDWLSRYHGEWEWEWDSVHIHTALAMMWWPILWTVVTVLLTLLTFTFIPIWLFCCCCRRGMRRPPHSKLVGIVVFSILFVLALACTIGAQLSAFRAVNGVDKLQCEGMAQPYDFLYEPTRTTSRTFDGLGPFLNYTDALVDRTRADEDLVRRSSGRLGLMTVPMVRGLFAPVLWTDSYLSTQKHHGWPTVDGADANFTLGLKLRHADAIEKFVESQRPTWPNRLPYGVATSMLLGDRSMTYDHMTALDTMGSVVDGINDGVETINEQLSRISDGMQKIQDLTDDMGGPGKVFEQTPWQYHWFPIVTYVFLLIGLYFFWRYIIRDDESARPSRGLRFYIFCGFFGSCLWFALASTFLGASSLSADVCYFGKNELLESGRYDDYFNVIINEQTQRLIDTCLTDMGNGDILEALNIDLRNIDNIDESQFDAMDSLFKEFEEVDSDELRAYVLNNKENLDFIESVKYPSPGGYDALSREALHEMTEELNAQIKSSVYVCTYPSRSVCAPSGGQSLHYLSIDNTYYPQESANPSDFFRTPPPTALLVALQSLSHDNRKEWIAKATDLIIRSRLAENRGFQRVSPTTPTNEAEWSQYIYDVCPLNELCRPFHIANTQSSILQSVVTTSMDYWRSRVKENMDVLTDIRTIPDFLHSLKNGFRQANPLQFAAASAYTVHSRWDCRRAFMSLDNLFKVVCARTAGNVAVNGWWSLLMGVVMLVGSSIAMAHWTHRRQAYIARKEGIGRGSDGEGEEDYDNRHSSTLEQPVVDVYHEGVPLDVEDEMVMEQQHNNMEVDRRSPPPPQ